MSDTMADRVRTRLDRLDTAPAEAAHAAGLPVDVLERLLDGRVDAIRGRRLVRLAEALSTSVAYLVGLDPDDPVPETWLTEDQGQLGLLALDEETLLRAYRRLDVAARAALLHVATRMAPEPETFERKPRQM